MCITESVCFTLENNAALHANCGGGLVAKSYPTVCYPMDWNPPGSSVYGISQARILEWVAISFSRGIFPTQGLNAGLLHCRQMLYPLGHQGNPKRPTVNKNPLN